MAHLGYFHIEFVEKRKWLEEHSFADLISLCQFLPGPTSSQVGLAIGLKRAGVAGSIAAWLGFTLPSAVLLVAFGLGLNRFQSEIGEGFLHGFKLVAVPVVAQALWAMGTKLCFDRTRASIAIGACALALALPFGYGQVAAMLSGALLGLWLLSDSKTLPPNPIEIPFGRRTAAAIFLIFLLLLCFLPQVADVTHSGQFQLFARLFRAGSLVFGGGHVVLPLLKAEVVSPGWISDASFMAGYGAAQAIPGPLFAFSAYLGSVANITSAPVFSATLCLVAAFLPSFFLVFGTLPFWEVIRRSTKMRSATQGINAAVVGLLLAAFYNPVWTSAVLAPKDFGLAAIGFVLLVFWSVPSWTVVLLTVLTSGALS